MTDFKYNAFISYSWSDKAQGAWLHHALETYRAPKGTGVEGRSLHPIFKDREEEAAGASIGAAIEAALSASEYLIVLCSPRSAASPWVNREVAWFKTHRDPGKILALIVEGEPGASAIPGREAEECFPKSLLFKVGPDLLPTEEKEDAPLAADARETGDGKRGAKLKLAAALLGVGLDALVKRDDRRRAQRRRVVMSGMAAGMAVLIGITVYAELQRRVAVVARNAAVAAEMKAEKQRDDAQGLVEYMVTDLRKRLDAVGRLDVLESVGLRLSDFYSNQDLAQLDADALGRRARVLLVLGEVDNKRGNLEAALARYKEAAATTEELLSRNAGSAQQIFDHAQSVFWVGYIAWQRGDAPLAKKQFTEYYDLAQQLVAIDPDKDEWRMEVGYAVNNLGVLALQQGNPAAAEASFRRYLGVMSELAAKAPGDADRMSQVGQAYAWLADSLLRQLKIVPALQQRLNEIEIYEDALVIENKSAALRESMAVAKYSVAQLQIARGDTAQALRFATDAARLAEELLALEPSSTQFTDRTSFAYAMLGEAQMRNGALADAQRSFAKALALAEELGGKDGSVVEWNRITGAEAKLLDARLDAVSGRIDKAVSKFGDLEADLRPALAGNAADRSTVRRYCSALAGRARLDRSYEGDWVHIVKHLSDASDQAGPDSLALLAEAYQRTGDTAKATATVRKLYATGYRHPEFIALLEKFPELKGATVAIAQ